MASRKHIHVPANIGEQAADIVASFVGSWSFVGLMTALLAAWIIWNSIPGLPHFDVFPFILLNLCLSFIAGYTGPFVMMSQNRQASKDRKRDDLEANEISEMFANHELLLTINQQQLEILNLLKQSKLRGGRSGTNRSALSSHGGTDG